MDCLPLTYASILPAFPCLTFSRLNDEGLVGVGEADLAATLTQMIVGYSTVEDCTWCYCPFYPCKDKSLGEYITSSRTGKKVWSCKNCGWIHHKDVAQKVLDQLKNLGVSSPEDVEKAHDELVKIKQIRWPAEAR